MQGENDQSNHMTRRHAETPLVVWLLGAHEAQGAVVAIFGVEVKRHGWTGEVVGIIIGKNKCDDLMDEREYCKVTVL